MKTTKESPAIDTEYQAVSAIQPLLLLVEDDSDYRKVLRLIVSHDEQTKHFRILEAASLSAALDCLASELVDVILLDLALPDSKGLSTLDSITASSLGAPVIVLTGKDDKAAGISAVSLGAQDYLVKHKISNESLIRSILYAVERKKADDSRTKLAVIQNFISTLAHDLQVPLIGADNVFRVLLSNEFETLSPTVSEVVKSLQNNNKQQLSLVQKLLDLYKYELGASTLFLHDVALKEIILAALETTRESFPKALVNTQLPELPLIQGDSEALIRLFGNLLDNAFRFSDKDKPVIISSSCTSDQIFIDIHNSGAPVPKELQTFMFSRFWQGIPGKKYVPHTGLGLYLSHNIARLHKGRIKCLSNTEHGTTMTVRLPILRKGPENKR